jgi:3',5'-cyclic AMP phosphodiesterase CpdA
MRRRSILAAVVAVALVAACGRSIRPTGPLRRSVPTPDPVEFVVIGDFGTGGQAEYAVARAVRAWLDSHPIDALVTTGDNIYEVGHPDRFEEAWHRPYGWVEREGIEVVASLGNHDVRTAGGYPVMRLLDIPWPWYAVRMGAVEFVTLDGNQPHEADQERFLRSALRDSTASWQVVLIHQPPFSCGTEHGSSADIQQLVPAMRGAELVLSGHDHTYQRFAPVGGVTFVVSGGGGAELDGVGDCPPGTAQPVAAFADTHHFLYVRVTEDALRIKAIRVPGSAVADSVNLSQ